MKHVGIRELKNRLSHYVRQARAGEEIVVTDRGEGVAELVPPQRRNLAPSARIRDQEATARAGDGRLTLDSASDQPGDHRAGTEPVPRGPVRTLDAVHLATALGAAQTAEDLAILSLDRRVRQSARALGLDVLPTG